MENERPKSNSGCGIAIAVAVVCVVLLFVVVPLAYGKYSGPVRTTSSYKSDRSDACFMAQKFVRERLKAPATAKFPSWHAPNCQAQQGGDIWRVRSYVDAQNGFGALIRSDYSVKLRYNPDRDTWTLLEAEIVSR